MNKNTGRNEFEKFLEETRARSLAVEMNRSLHVNDRGQVKNVKLKQIGDFYIYDVMYQSGTTKGDDSQLRNFIDLVKYNIMDSYAQPFYEIPEGSCSFIEDDSIYSEVLNKGEEELSNYLMGIGKEVRELVTCVKEHNKYEMNSLMVKCVHGHLSCYLTYFDSGEMNPADVFIVLYDSNLKIATSWMMHADINVKNDKAVLNSHFFSPIFISPKTRYVEEAVKTPFFMNNRYLYGVTLFRSIIKYYVSTANYGSNDEIFQSKAYDHRPFEMTIINRISNSLDENQGNRMTISQRINVMQVDNPDDLRTDINYKKRKVPDIVINPKYDAPVIDFNQKEISFMKKFLDQYKPWNGDKEINMADVFMNPRYGTTLIMPVQSSVRGQEAAFLSYDYNKNTDTVKFTISHRKDDVTVYVIYTYVEVSNPNWNLSDFLTSREISIYRHSQQPWPSSMKELFTQVIPSNFADEQFLATILCDLVDFFTIVNLRPDRSKVIRETTRIEDSEKVVRKSGRHNKVSKNKTESFVIRRILKDTKGAKEYISRMVTDGSPNKEYTLEEWDRVGHYRRKPHSEETVWIEPTKCHRRLPLSDKEVHIKL